MISKPLKISRNKIAFGKQIPATPVKTTRGVISGEYFCGDIKQGVLPRIPNIYEQDKNLNRAAWMNNSLERKAWINDNVFSPS